jgi:DNA-binding transcriptional LysR family regulator
LAEVIVEQLPARTRRDFLIIGRSDARLSLGLAEAIERGRAYAAAGEADLAIGFMPQLEAGFYQQSLFSQRFVCMVRRDHPRIDDKLTLKQFEKEAHIQVITSGTGHYIVDKVLQQRHVKRKIALRVPNFLGIALIVANSDLVVTVPARLAQAVAAMANVKTVESPISFPAFAVKEHWHERYHNDPRNQWIRNVVAQLFLETRTRK